MGLSMDFTDASGNVHSPAYWRAVLIAIDATGKTIRLVFYAFKDADAFAAGRQPLPGGVKEYRITGSEFAAVATAAPAGANLYDVLANASESYALAKQDVDSGAKAPDGSPVMVSFFATATVAGKG